MDYVTLNDKLKIPAVGLGLWRVTDEKECLGAVSTALKLGYRHFDVAQAYKNEQFLGEALEQSGVDRKELFITTKIDVDNMDWAEIVPSFEQSLAKLRMDYVDLLLIHFPVTHLRRPAWPKLESILKEGRAKSIGVSNYTIRHLEELLKEGNIKPAVNQVELHVYLQQPELVEYCKHHDIVVEAYSPLAHGYMINNPVLQSIAKKHAKSTAQIMNRWCLEIGAVPLPKSVHKERISQNLDVFNFKLDPDDMKKLTALNSGYRTCWDPTHVA